ncbi:TIC 62, chloroplastic-like protein [Drosera capensis]
MERPTDSYKETHNVKLSLEDTLFGGQVSNLQVAELIAYMAKSPSVSYYKVVEVIAETTAPLRPIRELLLEIPSWSTVVYSSKDNGAADIQDALPFNKIASETSTANVEEDSAEGNPTELGASRDMDPVFTFSGAPSEKEPVDDDSLIKGPLSPYTAYEDLKPPSSPKPNPPGQQGKATLDSSVMEAPPPSLGENGAPDIVQELAYPCSPYHV